MSIEVDPRLAHDTAATIAQAQELSKIVDRPNLLIKIPATLAGLPAITAVIAEGISVNVTLIFSLERYKAVMDAYLAGLEQAKASGHDISQIHSVASFFVSRVDSEIDKRLKAIGTPEAAALEGEAAIANARLAYQAYEQTFAGDRWDALQAAGANKQRPLWASTGVKDPKYDDTRYVVELVAPNTVNTAPEKTIDAVPTTASSAATPSTAPTPRPPGVLRPRGPRHRPGRRVRGPGNRRRREIRAGLERTPRIGQHRTGREAQAGRLTPATGDPTECGADANGRGPTEGNDGDNRGIALGGPQADQSPARPPGQAAAANCRSLGGGHLRGDRRSRPQEVDAGDL